jgi:hypothetical protein
MGGKCTGAVENGNCSVGPKLITSNELLNNVSCHGSFKRSGTEGCHFTFWCFEKS